MGCNFTIGIGSISLGPDRIANCSSSLGCAAEDRQHAVVCRRLERSVAGLAELFGGCLEMRGTRWLDRLGFSSSVRAAEFDCQQFAVSDSAALAHAEFGVAGSVIMPKTDSERLAGTFWFSLAVIGDLCRSEALPGNHIPRRRLAIGRPQQRKATNAPAKATAGTQNGVRPAAATQQSQALVLAHFESTLPDRSSENAINRRSNEVIARIFQSHTRSATGCGQTPSDPGCVEHRCTRSAVWVCAVTRRLLIGRMP